MGAYLCYYFKKTVLATCRPRVATNIYTWIMKCEGALVQKCAPTKRMVLSFYFYFFEQCGPAHCFLKTLKTQRAVNSSGGRVDDSPPLHNPESTTAPDEFSVTFSRKQKSASLRPDDKRELWSILVFSEVVFGVFQGLM